MRTLRKSILKPGAQRSQITWIKDYQVNDENRQRDSPAICVLKQPNMAVKLIMTAMQIITRRASIGNKTHYYPTFT